MLTELKLSNFRVFADEVTVRFRPITVLIGRNSSGKSSILKFLLMLQQSMDPGRFQFLTAEGDKVNLGVFSALKNSVARKPSLGFELAAKSSTTQLSYPLSEYLESSKDVDPNSLLYRASATASYSRRASMGRAAYFLIDETTGKILIKAENRSMDDSTFWHYPFQLDDLEYPSEPGNDGEETSKRFERIERRHKLFTRRMAEQAIIAMLGYQIGAMRHLPPVREESQRVIEASYPPSDDVGKRGQYTLPHLQQIANERHELYEFILPYLRSVAGIDSVKFRTSSGYVSRALATNKVTGAEVLLADYGFGVSQCLPIFVQGAIMAPHTSLMVEQPEAQLHPTAQLELGSFFADLWKKRNVGSIIETHSDNILLRLRRLIARGELSHEDVSVAFFTFDENNGTTPVIKNLDINEDGSMESGLPMEFFGADVIEGLHLGARA